MTESPIRNRIRQYLNENSETMAGLERRAGMAAGNLNKIMKGHSEMAPLTYDKLAPIVHWTPECKAECQAMEDRRQRIRRSGGYGPEPVRVPWPVTRDHAKSGRHLYATVRMLP